MPTTLKFVCFLLALVCFIVAAFTDGRLARGGRNVSLTALGLAFFAAPWVWDVAEQL